MFRSVLLLFFYFYFLKILNVSALIAFYCSQSPCFSSILGFISSLPQLAWDKRLCCCCCIRVSGFWEVAVSDTRIRIRYRYAYPYPCNLADEATHPIVLALFVHQFGFDSRSHFQTSKHATTLHPHAHRAPGTGPSESERIRPDRKPNRCDLSLPQSRKRARQTIALWLGCTRYIAIQ
jgi:hypothetical protein